MSTYAKGEIAQYTDRLAPHTGLVVIDEVIDDSGNRQRTARYAVHFEGSDQGFITDASHLQKITEKGSAVTGKYPNAEHKRADEAARRRALKAVTDIEAEAFGLRKRLERGIIQDVRVDADDTQALYDNLRKLTGHLAELGTLYDVREWHAADKADAAAVFHAGDQVEVLAEGEWVPGVVEAAHPSGEREYSVRLPERGRHAIRSGDKIRRPAGN
jgi:hypothetical protein